MPKAQERVEEFDRLFVRLKRLFDSEWKQVLGAEISNPQYLVLHSLHKNGTCKASILAKELGVTPGAVTSLTDALDHANLIIRERGTEDRRVVYIGLTEKGKNLLARVEEKRKQRLAKTLQALADEEVDVLQVILPKLFAAWESNLRQG